MQEKNPYRGEMMVEQEIQSIIDKLQEPSADARRSAAEELRHRRASDAIEIFGTTFEQDEDG